MALSLTPVQVTPFTLGNTTTQATNPQNGVTPTITNATVAGNNILAVVTAYNSGSNTFTIAPNQAGWVKLGDNPTPTTGCPYVAFWVLPGITFVGAGGNYGTWNVSASGGSILSTITYMEWPGLVKAGTTSATFIDNIAAFLSTVTPQTTTGTLSIAGLGSGGIPASSNEMAFLVATGVATAGGATVTVPSVPTGTGTWTNVVNNQSTVNGMAANIFTLLPGSTEPATTVTYSASATDNTVAGILLRAQSTAPSFSQYRTLSTTGNGLQPGTIKERELACLAVLASGQNPDGSVAIT